MTQYCPKCFHRDIHTVIDKESEKVIYQLCVCMNCWMEWTRIIDKEEGNVEEGK
jgi:hypothetical protein